LALAYEYFNVEVPATGLKKKKVEKLIELYNKNRARLDQVTIAEEQTVPAAEAGEE
jgi:hypothetical protein